MKNILSLVLCIILAGTTALAQEKEVEQNYKKNIKTEFQVFGVCGNCEKRIEKAALIKGVKSASWNRQTQVITLIYNRKKTNVRLIHESIAAIGHDTALVKAKDELYEELPGCCKYRDGIETH